jgi:putative FmdB family regulatory protein
MPTYEYRCKSCNSIHEIEHGFSDERPTTCPTCGGKLVRVFHPVGVVFKGSGFHRTDYAAKSGAEAGGSGDSSKKPDKAEPKASSEAAKPAADPKPGTTKP